MENCELFLKSKLDTGGAEVLAKDAQSPDMGCKKSCPCVQKVLAYNAISLDKFSIKNCNFVMKIVVNPLKLKFFL
jgi:hypothetical protein